MSALKSLSSAGIVHNKIALGPDLMSCVFERKDRPTLSVTSDLMSCVFERKERPTLNVASNLMSCVFERKDRPTLNVTSDQSGSRTKPARSLCLLLEAKAIRKTLFQVRNLS